MADSEGKKPTAFVIMPFGEGFDEIYDLFLVETLMQAGFDVARADNIKSSQNILKDIVKGIAESNLIVADLTDSNANVYYELGLAHALGTPVILLTQEISELPFDLRSYRVIPYKTHFADINRARKQLTDLATGLLRGDVEFGSPASDFLETRPEMSSPIKARAPEEGEAGFLDHMAEMEEGFERLGEFLTQIGSQTDKLGQSTTSVTERLKALARNPDTASARRARSFVKGLAQTLSDYSTSLSSINDNYTEELDRTRRALEAIVRAQQPQTPEEREQLEKFLSGLNLLEAAAREALAGTSTMAEALGETPSMERTYNRARDRAVTELGRLTDNIQQTVSMVVRAGDIGKSKLQGSPADGG